MEPYPSLEHWFTGCIRKCKLKNKIINLWLLLPIIIAKLNGNKNAGLSPDTRLNSDFRLSFGH